MSLHLHAVVRARHGLPDGSPFRLIEADDLAVIVSDHRGELTSADATAHLAALCALLPGGPVLPLRIGTTAVHERAAVQALQVPSLRAQLERLDGLAEVHVRLVFDEEVALRTVFDSGAFTGGGRDPVAQGERIVQAIVAWRGEQADELLAPVTGIARAVAVLDAGEPTSELRAFLISLDQLDTVRAMVSGFNGTCTGPLPAFHFLDLTPQPTSRWGW